MKRRGILATILSIFAEAHMEGKQGHVTISEATALRVIIPTEYKWQDEWRKHDYALTVDCDGRTVKFTPKELMDILEGK